MRNNYAEVVSLHKNHFEKNISGPWISIHHCTTREIILLTQIMSHLSTHLWSYLPRVKRRKKCNNEYFYLVSILSFRVDKDLSSFIWPKEKKKRFLIVHSRFLNVFLSLFLNHVFSPHRSLEWCNYLLLLNFLFLPMFFLFTVFLYSNVILDAGIITVGIFLNHY